MTKEFIKRNYWWDKDSHFSDIVLNGNEDIKREYEELMTKLNINYRPVGWSKEDNNYINIPVNLLKPTDENARIFNRILQLLRLSGAERTKRTPSGGITTRNYLESSSYDYTITNRGAEILVTTTRRYRIQFRSGIYENKDTGEKISGSKAFAIFIHMCKEYNIDLDKYKVSKEEGLKIKEEIENPIIRLGDNILPGEDYIWTKVHHIDIHNSYPAGLAETYPEFKDLINKLYLKRKTNEKYKAVLNLTIGYMQSKYCHYSLSKLSRDAIKVNNNKIRKLSEDLIKSGRTILLYNTDGIWYTGDIYHGENEGPDLGQWRNDHTDCILRIKSAGAYEFIEDKIYHPVVRGYTNLDKLKDRSQWEWGDIFNATEVIYKLTKDGITNIKGELF